MKVQAEYLQFLQVSFIKLFFEQLITLREGLNKPATKMNRCGTIV